MFDTECVTCCSHNVIYMLDTSGSMCGEKIEQLNKAMKENFVQLEKIADELEVKIVVRVLKFDNTVSWIIGNDEQGVDISEASKQWKDLSAYGLTNTAEAIEEVLKSLTFERIGTGSYRPIIILITDGESNDTNEMKKSTDKLKYVLSRGVDAESTVRVAIGVKDFNEDELLYFASKGAVGCVDERKYNVPLVFTVNEISQLSLTIQNATKSGIDKSADNEVYSDIINRNIKPSYTDNFIIVDTHDSENED